MQVTFQDLNPYLYYQPTTRLYHLEADASMDLLKSNCIAELQETCGEHENDILDVAPNRNTLQPGQIRINGEIKHFTHWNFFENNVPKFMGSYIHYKSGGVSALALAAICTPLSYWYASLLPVSAFLTVPALVALAITGIYLVCIKVPIMMQEMKMQVILDAQEYKLNGLFARAHDRVSHVYDDLVANEQRQLDALPQDSAEERARIEQRQNDLNASKELELRKYRAIDETLLLLKGEDLNRAAQLVVNIFKGLSTEPAVVEFQRRSQERFEQSTQPRS